MMDFGWHYPPGAEHDPNAPWNQREVEPVWFAEVKQDGGKSKYHELDADPDDKDEACQEAMRLYGRDVICIEQRDRESGEYIEDTRIWDDTIYGEDEEPDDDYQQRQLERRAFADDTHRYP